MLFYYHLFLLILLLLQLAQVSEKYIVILSLALYLGMPTSVVMARYSPSPTDIVSTGMSYLDCVVYHYINILDINSKSFDNRLLIVIVTIIFGTIVSVSLTAVFCIPLFIVLVKKKGLYNNLKYHK